jgi:hypothetical protein
MLQDEFKSYKRVTQDTESQPTKKTKHTNKKGNANASLSLISHNVDALLSLILHNADRMIVNYCTAKVNTSFKLVED